MLLVLQRGRSDCMLSFSGLWTRSSPQNKDWKRQQLTIRYLICAERKKKKGTGWYKSRAPLTQNSPPFFIIIYLWPIRSLYYPSARVVAYVPLITFVPIYFVLPFFLPTSVYTFHSLSLVFLDFVLHKNPAIPADKTKQNKKKKDYWKTHNKLKRPVGRWITTESEKKNPNSPCSYLASIFFSYDAIMMERQENWGKKKERKGWTGGLSCWSREGEPKK